MKISTMAHIGLAATAVLLSCGTEALAPAEDLKAIQTNFNAVSTNFTFDLWKKVDASEKDKNYFVSPLSLHTALGMLLNGAGGNTATEMKSTLKLNGLEASQANDTYGKIMENFSKIDPKVTALMANSVWYRKEFPFAKAYLDQNRSVFKATINAEDFNAATAKKINQWASDNTNKKIDKVIDEISNSDVMFLMNALYFKGDWTTPFDPKQTQDEDFNGLNGKKTVKMMNRKDNFGYVANNSFAALELPYGSEKFNMVLVLPTDPKISTSAFVNSLSAQNWGVLSALPKQKVNVKLPRFTLNYEVKLNDILQNMGMKEAFTAGNWSKLVDDQTLAKKLFLSLVKQNTYIGVDEKGTEAAAVTTIGVGVTSVGPVEPNFYCNRPFLFLIHEKTTGQIMFIGKIVNL